MKYTVAVPALIPAYRFKSQSPDVAIAPGKDPTAILNHIISTDVYPLPSVALTCVPEFKVVTRLPAIVDPAYATFVG